MELKESLLLQNSWKTIINKRFSYTLKFNTNNLPNIINIIFFSKFPL